MILISSRVGANCSIGLATSPVDLARADSVDLVLDDRELGIHSFPW